MDSESHLTEIKSELGHLTSQKGWGYAKGIAAEILAPFESGPARTDTEKRKREVYCDLKWFADSFVARIEMLARQSGKTPFPQMQTRSLQE